MSSERYRELVAACLAGELNANDAEMLLAECRRDPALLEELSALAVTERLLAYLHLYGDDETFVREVQERLFHSQGQQKLIILPEPWWRGKFRWALPVAACLLGLGLLGAFFVTGSGAESDVLVVRAEAVAAPAGSPVFQAGQSLPSRHIRFDCGLLELRFKSGAVVILEGPADFEVSGPLSCALNRGKIAAKVPATAVGFTVEGPRGRMVDLGTEFGVNVSASGDTEVHVLDGRVEAKPKGNQQPVELAANQAVRFSSHKTEPLPVDTAGFVTEMPPCITGPVGYLHWAFDEGKGDTSANTGQRLASQPAPARLLSFEDAGHGPAWVPGQFGYGLSLDGRADYVECDFPGIGGREPRTVAFWVKVPREIQLNESDAIVNWGTDAKYGGVWRISINNAHEDSTWGGPLGRLRVGVHGGYVVGSTDLRDDRWHHCAVVMYGGERPKMGSHVLIYIDGELEQAARKKVFQISTDVEHATAHNVWIGRNLSYREPGQKVLGGAPFFRGCVDELFIFNAALPQEQIVSLMKYNQLQVMPLIASSHSLR